MLLRYLKYRARAKSRYKVHSPFLFDFINEVLRGVWTEDLDAILVKAEHDYNKSDKIEIVDYGVGSKRTASRTLKSIFRKASSNKSSLKLLYHAVSTYKPKVALELGTNLGLSTAAIFRGNPDMELLTIEGDPKLSDLAKEFIGGSDNISFHVGNLDETLEAVLSGIDKLDFVYMDANHRYEPTIRYFNLIAPKLHSKSMVVLDDIHWSAEMEQAWEELIQRQDVVISVDTFFKGFLFFEQIQEKENYILKHY